MDLKKGYEKLYQHWLKEFQQTELTEFDQKLFDEYVKFMHFIKDYNEDNIDNLKKSVLQTYKDNVKFLFDDFLKMRETKIKASALNLREINLNKVIEAEKLLYNNLVSSVKGYNKVKKLAIYEEKELSSKLLTQQEKMKVNTTEVQTSEIEEITQINEPIISPERKKIKYILVRFLKKTPPLVGVDLLNYGPFDEQDIANLPDKNAKILILENFAEKIEID